MFSNRRRLQQFLGLLIGLTVTTTVTAYFFSAPGDRKSELLTFDWRMRNFNSLKADPRIVHVDIDDSAVERFGRWPWKRRQMASLVRTLSEFQPKLIMVDFLFSERETIYYDDPTLQGLPGEDVQAVGAISEENKVFGDLELADAIRRAGNVIMSAEFDPRAPNDAPPLALRLQHWRKEHDAWDVDHAIGDLGLRRDVATRMAVEREFLRTRILEELDRDFTLTVEGLAGRIGRPTTEISRVIAGTKRLAARHWVAKSWKSFAQETGRPPALDDVLRATLGAQMNRRTADRADVLAAFDWYQSRLATMQKAAIPLKEGGPIFVSAEVTPLIAPLAKASMHVAAVNFHADEDGPVRRVPVLMDVGGGEGVMHLGLSAAAQVMGLSDAAESPARVNENGNLQLGAAPNAITLPLDGNGGLIIHWTGTGTQWRTGKDMPHITAAKLMTIIEAQRELADNETAINYKLAEIVAASKGELVIESGETGDGGTARAADSPYRLKVNRQLELARKARMARLRRDLPEEEIAAMEAEAAKLLEALQSEQKNAVSFIKMSVADLAEIPEAEIAADPLLAADAKRFRDAARVIDQDIAALEGANESLRQSIVAVQAELSERLADKIVFLGFAATAQGDIVTTPIDGRTNGVMCHANVFNAIVQNRPIHIAPHWLGVAICLLGGALVSLATATLAPRAALISTIGLMVAYAGLNCEALFRRMDIWAPLAGPEICLFVSWAFVTLYRQLTAEREKRLFAKQLGQYTAPAIAAKIAENPQAAQAFKTVQKREVTCFFSDLAGFTSLSEAETAETIQHVLNTYLHRMSEVIWARRGLLNKFMGDGIMAFFNASVDPMKEHAHAAVETALNAMEELEKLKVERKNDSASRVFDTLSMRTGLASGFAMNGDMGSELKADYTVIGDVVNLAARLEPANKVFGTSIMVSGPTRELVRDSYDFRYLAELQVKGKAKTVPVYEVVCRRGQLTPEQKEYIERFEAGVELYKSREWDECIVHFTRMLARRFDDAGASRYIDACQEFKTFPPDDDWAGALELKEK
ncbi:MAG: adenylate/guanylate cyclase domain-containing protein [Planctomycetes bacterium]|nr:adenylate/guanylate cyclase domain-containing protein [Planctomycetota bacterium]